MNKYHIALLISLVVILITVVIGKIPSRISSSASSSTSSSTSNYYTKYINNRIKITGEEKDKAVSNIESILRIFSNNNVYFKVETSDNTYQSYIYNKNNECYAQSSDGNYSIIFRKDMVDFSFNTVDHTIKQGTTADILSILRSALNIANKSTNNNTIQLYEMKDNSKDKNSYEYRLELKGKDAIKLLYSTFGDSTSESIYNNLTKQLGEKWQPDMIIGFIVSNNNDFTSYCYIVDKNSNNENEEYLNWISDGYLIINDWSLDNVWYTTDFKESTYESIYPMLQGVGNSIDNVLEQYKNNQSSSKKVNEK